MAIHITGDATADQVLTDDSFALLVGIVLDQQYPMEHAFRGSAKVLACAPLEQNTAPRLTCPWKPAIPGASTTSEALTCSAICQPNHHPGGRVEHRGQV